ncbi:MAG: acetylornithine transaminase [Dehalococcoidales bacterium]|jgi:predicted acetylornithine/succinylornithine family transaminase|nr:acetylornithine transaminase [Dehalococcoidales bacterium]MDP6737826.1 acetylornithine transaminase [Dehalococcoidales bacterium]|tara:strand:+ start:32 stop:1219 length:1188 start_codon:yes stop_codon:yes gene_type:complete
MSNWPELEHKYLMHIIDRTPVVIVKGKGARVWDETGREYIDFVAGWAVDSLGHCHPVVVEATTKQVHTLIQTSNQFYTIPQLRLAELLVKHSCLDKVFFSNSGTEANEGAIKLARRYGKLHLNGAYEIITTTGSFHGRTLAMVAASGQAKFQQPYIPLPAGFINVEFNDIAAIKTATTNQTCAVMLEPIQGESGVNLLAEDYLAAVRNWCDQKGILLILDEIQTGIARTGTLFAYEQYGIEPDIMTLAKGLASGVPIGAIMAKNRAAVFAPGEHGSTYGGNPLACAAGYATLKYIIDCTLAENARQVGQYLMDGLRQLQGEFPFVTEVRGRGLLVAMEFNADIGQSVVTACLERGLLINRVKPNAIRFVPPLIIDNKEVDRALDILGKVLDSLAK